LDQEQEGKKLKTGIIIYIVGDTPNVPPSDPMEMARKLMLGADRLEIVSSHYGHFDVHDAWWSLVSKGMQRILCTLGEYNPCGQIQLKSQTLRLCG
jgi:hypothetical protein